MFGDLVPLILANGLGIDILISMSPLDTQYRRHVQCEHLNVPDDTIYVYKEGDHYDGIVPIHLNNENTDCYNSVTHMKYKKSCSPQGGLKFLVWNINGLTEHKLNKDIAGELMMKYDIILLSEIWIEAEQEFYLNGYQYHNFPRTVRHKKAKRASGGLGVFIKNEICDGITVLKKKRECIVWLRLKKSFFRFDKDIYIGSVYIPPEGSSYVYDGIYEEIQQDILAFPENSEILLLGDYNARTSTRTDFIFPLVVVTEN